MQGDIETLKKLNIEINDAENNGNDHRLAEILAPRLAFQRADQKKTVDDQVAFLQKVESGGTREIQIIDPIELYGDRAIVKCIVTTVDDQKFHNLRLFVRREGQWKLLGWANEKEKGTS